MSRCGNLSVKSSVDEHNQLEPDSLRSPQPVETGNGVSDMQ